MKRRVLVSFILIISFFLLGMGEDRALKVKDFSTEKRVALVIGNSDYKFNPLKNPGNDAEDIAKELKKFGFEVILKKDVNRREMSNAIKDFGKKIRNGGVGLFYFAGHGVQIKGENYLIPLNEDIETEEDVEFEAIKAGRILAEMEKAGNKMNVIILDACRNNPFESSSRSGTRGLARMDAPTGSLLVYSTSPGKTALDGDNARNGVFTESLLTELRTNPQVNINDLLINVRTRVISKTDNAQTPWESSSLTGKFYFARSTVDEYESFRNEQKTELKEFEIKESNLKDVIKRRAEYRIKMKEEFASINSMEGDDYITPEEKIILWEEFMLSFPEDNPFENEVREKIVYWQNYEENDNFKEEYEDVSGKFTYFEDFFYDNKNDWYEADNSEQDISVDGDGYYIYNKTNLQKVWLNDMIDEDADFTIETTISKLGGYNNNGLNILFGGDNGGGNFYIFGTTGTGYYGGFKYDNGWQDVVPWKQSTYVNRDDATNDIRVEKIGNSLNFYVNDNYVHTLNDYAAYGPAVGFAINPDIEAKVRSLKITIHRDEIVFDDEFEDDYNGWIELDQDGIKLEIRNGRYEMFSRDQFYKTWQNDIFDNFDQNFEIETEISRESGIENNIYGILFGMDSSGANFYQFGVSPNGYYALFRYDGNWNNEISWTKSSLINTGTGQNHLRVKRVGKELDLYINGEYINTVKNYESYGLATGIGVASGMKIGIENFKVKLIK